MTHADLEYIALMYLYNNAFFFFLDFCQMFCKNYKIKIYLNLFDFLINSLTF